MIHPVIFEIGAIKITWFGVMLATGFFSAYISWIFIGKRIGRDSNFAADLLLWIMISGILGARVAYIFANFSYFMEKPMEMFMIMEGGLVYYGGLIGGGLGLYVFSRRRKMEFRSVLDFVITAVPIAHCFGRIGCFINGCCHGTLAKGSLGVTYPHLSQPWRRHIDLGFFHRFERIRSLPVHPVQLYEAVFNLLLFGLMLYVYPRYRDRPGKTLGAYLMLYPTGRLCFELLRGDNRHVALGPLSLAQTMSILLLVSGIVVFVTAARKNESSKESTS